MYTIVGFHKILPQHLDDYIENMRICAEKSNQESGPAHIHVVVDWLGSLRRAFAR